MQHITQKSCLPWYISWVYTMYSAFLFSGSLAAYITGEIDLRLFGSTAAPGNTRCHGHHHHQTHSCKTSGLKNIACMANVCTVLLYNHAMYYQNNSSLMQYLI